MTQPTDLPTDAPHDPVALHRALDALDTLKHYVETGWTDLDEWAVRNAVRRLMGRQQ